jgi:thiol-disulfide isomerase/thioredoxin
MRTARNDHFYVVVLVIALVLSSADRACAMFGGGDPNQAQLYFFTNEGCRPCKQVEPVLRELADRGYPITKVDTTAFPNWVQQFRVTSTPTVVLVKGSQEITRHSGFIDAGTVQGWFAQIGFRLGQQKASDVVPLYRSGKDQFIKDVNAKRDADRIADDKSTLHNGTRTPADQFEQQALKATVRIRVEDPEGISYATGTVIHCHEGEWLVLTCGHVFRDAEGKGKITAEYDFDGAEIKSAPGRMISYDAKARDIGLISVQAGVDIQPVSVATRTSTVTRGNEVFSIGCDHGQLPTIRHTRIKNKAKYDNVVKYDIYGRPVDGRSGGGLFTADGQLIGVCNAASVDFDEGIYTGLDTIYWQIAQENLDHLFPENPQGLMAQNRTQPVTKPPRADLIPANIDSGIASDLVAVSHQNPDEVRPPFGTARSNPTNRSAPERFADARPFREVGRQWPEAATTGTSAQSSDMEVILILRSTKDPTHAEAITLSDPSPKLLKYLERLGNQQTGETRIDMAQLRQQIAPAN